MFGQNARNLYSSSESINILFPSFVQMFSKIIWEARPHRMYSSSQVPLNKELTFSFNFFSQFLKINIHSFKLPCESESLP